MLSVHRCLALRPRHFPRASRLRYLQTSARRPDLSSPSHQRPHSQRATFVPFDLGDHVEQSTDLDESRRDHHAGPLREGGRELTQLGLPAGRPLDRKLHEASPQGDRSIVANSIVIKNIPKDAKEQELLEFITELGSPIPYTLKVHLHNGVPSGVAFAKFMSLQDAASSFAILNKSSFNGRQLRAEYKKRLSAADRAEVEARHLSRRASHHRTPAAVSGHDARASDSFARAQMSSLTNGIEHKPFKHWANLLSFLTRVEGKKGALRILNLLDKHRKFLPTEGTEADELWTGLVQAGIPDPSQAVLERIFDHAQHIYTTDKRVWEPLYESIVRPFLESFPNKARAWNSRLGSIGLPTETSLRSLVDAAVKSRSRLDTLKMLHYESRHNNLYDVLIPALCRRQDYVAAAHFDQYLKEHGDCPTSPEFDLSQLQNTSVRSDTPKSPNRGVQTTGAAGDIKFADRRRKSQGGLSDSFAARCLATKAFSLDAISRGLKSIGLSSLGPLALREIAARCDSSADVLRHVNFLEKSNVPIQECVYSRFLHHLAKSRDEQILKSTVQSDLHPDAFEDVELQRRLLTFYIKSKDWAQAHRTLKLLATAFNETGAQFWNSMLCAHLADKDWSSGKTVYELMLARGIPISQRTIRMSFFSVEARSYIKMGERGLRRAEKLQHEAVDDLKFVTNMWLKIQRAGGFVSPKSWNQLHKYYGQDYRLTEFESLSMWLAAHYSQTSPLTLGRRQWSGSWRTHSRVRCEEQQNALAQIFHPLRQRSIIEWGFKTLASKEANRSPLGFEPSNGTASPPTSHPSWDRGLLLLKELQRYGLKVHKRDVRRACQSRVSMMFSDSLQVSSRRENRMAKLNNSQGLLAVLRRIDDIWRIWPSVQEPDMTEAQARALIGSRRGRSVLHFKEPSPGVSDSREPHDSMTDHTAKNAPRGDK